MPGSDAPLRTRLLPALLTALGVTLLAAGLLTYGDPVAADPSATGGASPSPTTAAVVTPSPRITLPPIGSASPGSHDRPADAAGRPGRDPGPDRGARHRPAGHQRGTRRLPAVRRRDVPQGAVPAGLRAGDLPVCPCPDGHVPAAARDQGAASSAGSVVEVWTSDDRRFTVRDHRGPAAGQTRLDDPLSATTEELWLQTSEGPEGHGRQDPGHRALPRQEAGRPGGCPPEGPPDRLRLTTGARA